MTGKARIATGNAGACLQRVSPCIPRPQRRPPQGKTVSGIGERYYCVRPKRGHTRLMVVACRRRECDAGPEREYETRSAKARRAKPSMNLRFLQAAICLLSIITFGASAHGQKVGGAGASGGGGSTVGTGGTSSRATAPSTNTNSGVYNSGTTNSSPNAAEQSGLE